MSASMSTVCVHCHSTIPDETEDFEILLRSRTALTCIFKLDYLTAFDLMKNQDPLESFESWTFCQPCRQLLSRLQQLYKEFMHVGKLESYIVKQLNQLDEIIESHRLKEIQCDLLCDLEEEEGRFCQNSDEEPSLKKSRITPSPRSEIQLTRLSEKDLTLQTAASYDESGVKQEPSDESAQLYQDDEFTDYGNVNSVSSFYNEDNSEDNSTYSKSSQKRKETKKSGKASRSKMKMKIPRLTFILDKNDEETNCSTPNLTDRQIMRLANSRGNNSSSKSSDSTGSNDIWTPTDPFLEPQLVDKVDEESHSDIQKKKRKSQRKIRKPSQQLGPKQSCPSTSQEMNKEEKGRFVCEVCSRTFSRRRNLNSHMNTHTRKVEPVRPKAKGHRPWECRFCPSRFLQQVHLFQHERRHTGERPYQCQKCPANFIQKSSLDNHMKKH